MRVSCLGPGDFLPFPLRFLQEITSTTEPTVLRLPWDTEFNFSSLLYALIEKFMAGHRGGQRAAAFPMVHWAGLMAFTLLQKALCLSLGSVRLNASFLPNVACNITPCAQV